MNNYSFGLWTGLPKLRNIEKKGAELLQTNPNILDQIIEQDKLQKQTENNQVENWRLDPDVLQVLQLAPNLDPTGLAKPCNPAEEIECGLLTKPVCDWRTGDISV